LPSAGLTLLPPQMAAGLPATAGQLMPGFTFVCYFKVFKVNFEFYFGKNFFLLTYD